jgi:hypothetical protein
LRWQFRAHPEPEEPRLLDALVDRRALHLKRTFRVTACLRRSSTNAFRAIGALIILCAGLGAWSAAFSEGTAVNHAALGAAVCVLPVVGLWLNPRINGRAIVVDWTSK